MMKEQRGIILVKLIVILAVIGILAGLTLPSYQKHYQQRAFNEALMKIDDVRKVVDVCYNTKKSISWCHQGADKAVHRSVLDVQRHHNDKVTNISVAYWYGVMAIKTDTGSESGSHHIDLIGHAEDGRLIWAIDMDTTECDEVKLCKEGRWL